MQDKLPFSLSRSKALPGLWTILSVIPLFSSEKNCITHLRHLSVPKNVLILRSSDAFAFISFYTYFLNVHSTENVAQVLMLESLPSLALLNDAYVTTSLVRTAIAIMQPVSTICSMEWIGLTTLLNIWLVQPRIWSVLKQAVSTLSSRVQAARRGHLGKTGIDNLEALERCVTLTIK